MKQYIYIAEDDDNIRELLRCTLESYGYVATAFEEGQQLLDGLGETLPDLILLDIMMPGLDGIETMKALRQNGRTSGIPVIFLTAKSSEVDKVRGLDLGADDYITKPFGLLELSARVRAALRRNRVAEPLPENLLVGGDIRMDVDNHEVLQGEKPLELTLKEFDLLRILLSNPNRVVPRDELLNLIWGYDYMGETRTLDMHIKTLRAKLGDDAENPRYIRTVRSVGYKFVGKQG